MGRPRKIVDINRKHLTNAEKSTRRLEEKIITTNREQLRKVPNWLIDNVAKKEFKRLSKELLDINVIGNLDTNNLACYCNAYANYLKVTKELADEPFLVEKISQGTVIKVKNPLIDVQTNYANEMRKFANLCGLTIDSRLKVASVKVEEKQQNLSEMFGNI